MSNEGEKEKWEIKGDALVCNEKRTLYRQIAYEEIIQWLQKAQYEVCNIKNLDSALGFYIDVLQQLLQRKENTMGIKGFFKDRGKELEIAFEIIHNKEEVFGAVAEYIAHQVAKESGLKAVAGVYDSWLLYLLEDENNTLCFCFDIVCKIIKNNTIWLSCDIYLEDYGFLDNEFVYWEEDERKREKFKQKMHEILNEELNMQENNCLVFKKNGADRFRFVCGNKK